MSRTRPDDYSIQEWLSQIAEELERIGDYLEAIVNLQRKK